MPKCVILNYLHKSFRVRCNADIDLELFLKFNKMRPLVTDTETLARALAKSQLLQVRPAFYKAVYTNTAHLVCPLKSLIS